MLGSPGDLSLLRCLRVLGGVSLLGSPGNSGWSECVSIGDSGTELNPSGRCAAPYGGQPCPVPVTTERLQIPKGKQNRKPKVENLSPSLLLPCDIFTE